MKKFSLVFLLSSTVLLQVASQPVLQESWIATVGTITGNVYLGPVVSAGIPGINETWDFSSATLTQSYTLAIVDPSVTPYASTFPSSNYCIAFYSSVLGNQFHYYDHSNGKLETLGENISAAGGDNFNPDPRTELQFPFNFLDLISDTWKRTDSVSGNVIVLYDAYGTLITPFGTYNNVVRVNFNDGQKQKFIWYNTDPIYPIWTLVSPDSFSVAVDLNPVGIENQSSSHLDATVFPIPAHDQLNIGFSQPVAISEMTFHVYDMVGKEVNLISFNEQNLLLTTMNVQQLPKGIYFLQITSGAEQITKRFCVE